MCNLKKSIYHREVLCQKLASTSGVLDAANAKISSLEGGSIEVSSLQLTLLSAYRSIDIICNIIDTLISEQRVNTEQEISFEHLYPLTEQLGIVVSNLEIIAEALFDEPENPRQQIGYALHSADSSLGKIISAIQ